MKWYLNTVPVAQNGDNGPSLFRNKSTSFSYAYKDFILPPDTARNRSQRSLTQRRNRMQMC